MKKSRALIVGEHPAGTSGNSGMLHSLLSTLDLKVFDATVLTVRTVGISYQKLFYHAPPFPMIDVSLPHDQWGQQYVLNMTQTEDFQMLIFVGIDIWRYADVMKYIRDVRDHRGFTWIWIMPYDIPVLREDWCRLIDMIDYPCVYSDHGYQLVKERCPHSRYFRPSLQGDKLFEPYDIKKRKAVRAKQFPTIKDEFLFGFVGANSNRKDPQKIIKALSIVQKKYPDTFLYMHTQMKGVFNLPSYARDCRILKGTIKSKTDEPFDLKGMVDTYNSIDCLINCSYQEGLSWTPIEAMLCKTPVILSDSTAHKELITDATGYKVPCETETYLKLYSDLGDTMLDAKCCNAQDIADVMIHVLENQEEAKDKAEKAYVFAKNWVENVTDITSFLTDVATIESDRAQEKNYLRKNKYEKILFVQHSAAGDVLMTTQCFKGIKEKHPGMPLVYMTQKRFQNIIEGNQYVDEIIDWDEEAPDFYEIVYNPHGEKILPGGWNNLDVRLHAMYPYFCDVKSDKIQIVLEPIGKLLAVYPDIFSEPYIVVHTTGGSAEYRTYPHFDIALKSFKKEYKIIQIGGKDDLACKIADLDLRGQLTFRQTASVVDTASAFVGVDSFPMHLSASLGVPTVALFGPAPSRVTGPRWQPAHGRTYAEYTVWCVGLEPDMLAVCKTLSHCWSSPPQGKQKCESPCINTINPNTVKNALKEILK